MGEDLESTVNETEVKELKREPRPIYFHTTPTSNIDSIFERGLIAPKEWDTFGDNIDYSLFFEEEYRDPPVNRPTDHATSFAITIWGENAVSQFTTKGGSLHYGIKSSGNSAIDPPAEFHRNLTRGAPIRKDLEKVDPSNLLAILVIKPELQEAILRTKVSLLYKKQSEPSEIKQALIDFLTSYGELVVFPKDYSVVSLGEDIFARIQQDVSQIKDDPERIERWGGNTGYRMAQLIKKQLGIRRI